MPKFRKIVHYLLFLLRKLGYLGVAIVVMNLIVLAVSNLLFFHMPFTIPLLVFFFPLGCFLVFFFFNQLSSNFKNNMAHYKYSFYLPFIFYDNPHPEMSERININTIRSLIRPGDIILRRYDGYIDGLIFSENSYFTHAGIYCSDYRDYNDQVLHAEAEAGVHADSLDTFCHCDDVAVLRFSYSRNEQENRMLDVIEKNHCTPTDLFAIAKREKEVFTTLLEATKPGSTSGNMETADLYATQYTRLILDRAISLLHTPYDFEFNFGNFESLSCIEYVWYCFKSLYPLHRISVNDFEFFRLIRIPVIVPDVFIRNDFFQFVYTSLPGVTSKHALAERTRPDHWQFWKFMGMIVVWDIIFLWLAHFIYYN